MDSCFIAKLTVQYNCNLKDLVRMKKKARKDMENARRVESLKSFTISVFSLLLINYWFSSKYFFIILRLHPCDFGKRTDNFQCSQWRQSYFIKKNYMIIVVLSRLASF